MGCRVRLDGVHSTTKACDRSEDSRTNELAPACRTSSAHGCGDKEAGSSMDATRSPQPSRRSTDELHSTMITVELRAGRMATTGPEVCTSCSDASRATWGDTKS